MPTSSGTNDVPWLDVVSITVGKVCSVTLPVGRCDDELVVMESVVVGY